MYKLESYPKDALLPYLVYSLLEMYAGGFEYREKQDEDEIGSDYMLRCGRNPFLEEPPYARKALLIQEEKGRVRCRAGGLSLTMLAEMSMVVYYAYYAEMYDEEKPTTQKQYKNELENMKDYLRRLVEKDEGIRSVPRGSRYFGYFRKGNEHDTKCYPNRFDLESDPGKEPQKDELLNEDNPMPLDCFGRSNSSLYLSYQLMDDVTNSEENLLMLNCLYQQDEDGKLVQKKDHTKEWPQKLLSKKERFSDGNRSKNPEGWFYFSELLNLQTRSMVYIWPAYSAYQNKGIAMKQGRYALAWHQSEQGVDSIVFMSFDPSMKKIKTGEKKEIVEMSPDFLSKMNKKMAQAEKSRDRFQYKRKKTKQETEDGQPEYFKIMTSLSNDMKEAAGKESRILKSEKGEEPLGFLLTDLLPRDFWGYRHVESGLLPDMLIFWSEGKKQTRRKKSEPNVQEESK